MKKTIVVIIVFAVIGAAALFIFFKPHSDDPRKKFASQVVDTLAANNWERSALKTFLCDDPMLQRNFEQSGLSFDLYQGYDGIKAVGKIKLIPVATPPAMATDTFIPILFNKQFVPFPTMPDHMAYHATYIQLQTQKTSDGQWCLPGWGRNEIPVNPDQAEDFLSYKGIFNHD
jgi:hypothetical protein